MQFIDILKKLLDADNAQQEQELDAIITNTGLNTKERKEAQELITQIRRPSELSLKDTLLAYAQLAYIFEKNGIPEEHANKLAELFDTKANNVKEDLKNVMEYLLAFAKANPQAQLMHDACGFVLPQGKEADIAQWKILTTRQPKGGQYPLLNANFKKILGLSKDLVDFINKKSNKELAKASQNKLIDEIKAGNVEVKEAEAHEHQENVFKPTSVFKIQSTEGETKLIQEIIREVTTEEKDKKIQKMGLRHLDKLIAAYTKLCDQYESNTQTLGKLIGEENYLHALAKRQALRAKRSEFYIGQPFKQLGIEQLFDYYEAYLQENPDPIRAYFTEKGLSKQKHTEFLQLDRSNAGIHIPDVFIDGATVGCPGFYLKKLDVKKDNEAAIAATLGKLTGCCQSLSGEAGESCVIHSLTDPDGGCYAIFKGDFTQAKERHATLTVKEMSEAFQGGMWVWRSINDALVFDSIEMVRVQGKGVTSPELIQTGVNLVHQAARVIIKDSQNRVEKINCGMSSGISDHVGIESSPKLEQFKAGYVGYSDAAKLQRVIKDKTRPYYCLLADEMHKEDTDEITQWINDRLNTDNIEKNLWEAVNWAIVNQKTTLIARITELATQKGSICVSAVQTLINMLQQYVNEGLTPEIIAYIRKMQLYAVKDKHGNTPLLKAVNSKNIEVMQTMIEEKVDLEAQNAIGDTALIAAVRTNNIPALKILIGANANLEAITLLIAVQQNNMIALKALIEANFNLETSADDGNTPLLKAVQSNNMDALKALIDAKANLEAKNKDGETALMIAVRTNNMAALTTLLDAKPNLDAKNKRGRTALTLAVQARKIEMINILAKAKANLDVQDNFGETALMLAVEVRDFEVMQILIELGANPAVAEKKEYGDTVQFKSALNVAMTFRAPQLIRALIDAKADLEEKFTTDNRTAVMVASTSDKPEDIEILRDLIKARVNLEATDRWKKTALMLAIESGNTKGVQLLIEGGAKLDDVRSIATNATHRRHNQYKTFCEQENILLERSQSFTPRLSLHLQATNTEQKEVTEEPTATIHIGMLSPNIGTKQETLAEAEEAARTTIALAENLRARVNAARQALMHLEAEARAAEEAVKQAQGRVEKIRTTLPPTQAPSR